MIIGRRLLDRIIFKLLAVMAITAVVKPLVIDPRFGPV